MTTDDSAPTREAEPLYVYFDDEYHGSITTTEVRDGVMFDVDPRGTLIGIEVLDYKRLTLDGKPIAARPQPVASEGLRTEDLDDLREHFVNGSGAYTDSALVGRLVVEIDRLRAVLASQPDLRAAAERVVDADLRAQSDDPSVAEDGEDDMSDALDALRAALTPSPAREAKEES